MRAILVVLIAAGPVVAGPELKYLPADEFTGGSSAVVVGDEPLVHTAQLIAPAAKDQAGAVLRQVLAAVAAGGGDAERVVKLNVGVATADQVGPVREAIARQFPEGKRPAVGFVVGKLSHPEARVGIDAVAVATRKGDDDHFIGEVKGTMPVGGAAAAVMPAGRRVYVAGQAEKGDTPAEATRKTLASLRATLEWLGLADRHVVQCKAFLTPMSAAADVVAEFRAHFGKAVPPLVLVEWQSTLPIEIELIAAAPGPAASGAGPVEFLTPPGMTASPIYSRVTRTASDRYIYTGGLVSAKPGTGDEQVTGTLDRLHGLMREAGSDLNHLVKATYYVADDEVSASLNKLRPRYYDPKRPPAASKAKVAGVGVKERTLVIDMIAVPAKK